MAELTTAQKAPIYADGELMNPDDGECESSDDTILSVGTAPGHWFAYGESAGDATITVTRNGRTGTLTVTVTEQPIVVTLGTPEPA